MGLPIPQRSHPRTWATIAATINDPFTIYNQIWERIGVPEESAAEYFGFLFESSVSTYSDHDIRQIFLSNLYANSEKYNELCTLYEAELNPVNNIDISESFSETRTPNLTSTSTSSGTGSSTGSSTGSAQGTTGDTTTTERKQTQTSTSSTPSATKTSTHEVNPYDNTGLRTEYKDTVTDATATTTTTAYSGNPDTSTSSGTSSTSTSTQNTTSTTSSASGTVTETGTETKIHTITRQGRDWKILPNEVVAAAEEAAAAMNVLYVICQDLADLIFLQVWD